MQTITNSAGDLSKSLYAVIFFIEIQGCHHHLPLFQTLLRYTNTINQFNQIFQEIYLLLKYPFIETEYSKFSS